MQDFSVASEDSRVIADSKDGAILVRLHPEPIAPSLCSVNTPATISLDMGLQLMIRSLPMVGRNQFRQRYTKRILLLG
jgi:hypothetical protein